MKRYGNIYSKICDIDNLREAHKNARKKKTFYSEVKVIDKDVDHYLFELQKMLINKTYHTSEYEIFTKNDKGKEREIYKLPYYPDRITHWAIMQQIEPILLSTFTDFMCASIPKKGIHYASYLLRPYLNDVENTRYCLKLDIKKFFPNINHDILKKKLARKFKDPDLLWLLYEIIDSIEGDIGVPIGNYLSQYFANFYVSDFAHWLKEVKHVKYVVFYMDDIVILGKDKKELHDLRKDIEEYLLTNLKISLKDNWQVFPTDSRGIDFVGYRHFHDYTLLRKSTAKTMKKKMRYLQIKDELSYSEWCTINSYNGWLKYCDSYRLKDKYIVPLKDKERQYYYKHVKGGNHAKSNQKRNVNHAAR